jgi:hypothetical protein
MGKISQVIARDAAKKICEPLYKEWQSKKKELGILVESYIVRDTPKDVLAAYEKHPEYFKTSSNVQLEGVGIDRYLYVNWDKRTPVTNSYSWNVSAKDSPSICKLQNEIHDAEKKYNATVADIENTILTLCTHKRVEEQMPEVYPYVAEKPTNNQLMLNIQPIREMVCTLIPGCTSSKKEEPVAVPVEKKRSHKKKVVQN